MLPDLAERQMCDLGCGFGWFCRWARQHGAAHILGLDLSEKILERAHALTDDSAAYATADLETLSLPDPGFDLVNSSLAHPSRLGIPYHDVVMRHFLRLIWVDFRFMRRHNKKV